jgi:endonuclease YncB( thermonuclease family)
MTEKAPAKSPDKAEKAAASKADAPTSAKAAKAAALPDAALVDGEDASSENTATPARGWLPASTRGWVLFGAGAAGAAMVAITAVYSLLAFTRPAPAGVTTLAGVASAVDGATLSLAGRRVRLEGIEAPPSSLICRDDPWKYRCGEDARRGLELAIGRQPVDCVLKSEEAATCRNENGFDIAALQVENGWAVIDVRHSSRYFAEQARAQQENRGLWRNDFASPERWRLAARADNSEAAGISAVIRR